MTAATRRVLELLEELGRPVSARQVGELLDCSRRTAAYRLELLARSGKLARLARDPRHVEIRYAAI